MLELLDARWRRAGFGESQRDRELFDKAQSRAHPLPRAAAHAGLAARLVRAAVRLPPRAAPRARTRRSGRSVGRGGVDDGGVEAQAARGQSLDGRTDNGQTRPPARTRWRPSAQYELIDYKTSRPKTAEQLHDDIQLSLYALAAREDWGLECSQQAYYYVLDDLKVPVARDTRDAQSRQGHRARGRRRNPRAGVRAHALAKRMLYL